MTQLTENALRWSIKNRPLTTRGEIESEREDGLATLMFYVPVGNLIVAKVTYRYVPGSIESVPDRRRYTVQTTWWDEVDEGVVGIGTWHRWREISSYWLSDRATVFVSKGRPVSASSMLIHLGRAEMVFRAERLQPVQTAGDPQTLNEVLSTAENRVHGLINRLLKNQH